MKYKDIIRRIEQDPVGQMMGTNREKKIAKILFDSWTPDPALRAARALNKAGISLKDLHAFGKSEAGRKINSMWVTNTFNELQNIEHEMENFKK